MQIREFFRAINLDEIYCDRFIVLCNRQGIRPEIRLENIISNSIAFNRALQNPPKNKKCSIVFKTSVNADFWDNFKNRATENNKTVSQLFSILVQIAPDQIIELSLSEKRKRDGVKRKRIGIKIDTQTQKILDQLAKKLEKPSGTIGGQILDAYRFII